MLRTRLLTAAIALPLLTWLGLWASSFTFGVVVMIFTFIALREYAAMGVGHIPGATTLTVGGGMIIASSMWLDPTGAAVSAGIVLCLIGVLLGTLTTA